MYLHAEEIDQDGVRAGTKNFTALRCLSCHVLTEEALEMGASSLAPSLAMAHERLRPDWIIDWLTDPQTIEPGTNMPSYFYSEGIPFYDDADEQIRDLRDYLMTLRPQ
jgi:cbb3-type cytochrome oxidase cytochrome c subunit